MHCIVRNPIMNTNPLILDVKTLRSFGVYVHPYTHVYTLYIWILIYILWPFHHCLGNDFSWRLFIAKPSSNSVLTHHHSLLWRHNGRDGVSNHQPHDSLLDRSCRCRSKKTSKLRVTGLCAWNSPVTGEFPAQMVSNAEKGLHLMTSSWVSHRVKVNKNSVKIWKVSLRKIHSRMSSAGSPPSCSTARWVSTPSVQHGRHFADNISTFIFSENYCIFFSGVWSYYWGWGQLWFRQCLGTEVTRPQC